jgi:hypothetical protein
MCLFLLRANVHCQRIGTGGSSQRVSPIDILSPFVIGFVEHGVELHQFSNEGGFSILQIDSNHDGGIIAEQEGIYIH